MDISISRNTNIMDDFLRTKSKVSSEEANTKKYARYYDVNHTITTAQATNPNDPDHANYNQEQININIHRNAEFLNVSNDEASGSGRTLFVIVSHDGFSWSRETNIEPQEIKEYHNVYELRLRSATQGAKYRVTEYKIRQI